MFYLAYRLTKPNALCSDEGFAPILDKDECRVAFSSIQDYWPSINKIDTYCCLAGFPKGCIFYSPRNEVHWNQLSNTGRNTAARQICKQISM